MAAPNRTALLTKLYKALKKQYQPTLPNLKVPLMEQLLYACCLEDATAAAANKAFAALTEQYFDWNEVRVSTVTELSETISMLPEPAAAASRFKRVLQSVFESAYSFDLESLKKQNIGVSQKRLAKYDGVTPFGVAFATQTALGGHSIPLGRGALDVLFVVGAINEKERLAGEVPGLERAIPKNKGLEFASLINQVGVEFQRSPNLPAVKKLLLSVAPDAKNRFPKRGAKPAAPPAAADGVVAAEIKGKGKEPMPPAGKHQGEAEAAAAGAKKKGVLAQPPSKTPPAKQPVQKSPAAKAAKSQSLPPGKKLPAKTAKARPLPGKGTMGRGAPRKPR